MLSTVVTTSEGLG